MNVGTEGVIFIWVMFLWPVIVSSVAFGLFGKTIEKKVKYWFVSVLVGYVFFILAGNLATYWLLDGINQEDIRINIDKEKELTWKTSISFGLMLLVPALVSAVVLRWRRRKDEASGS